MRENAHERVTEFIKDLYASGSIDADRFDTGMAAVLAASTEGELVQVVRSLPSPITLTSPERQLSTPLEIRGGVGRLRLEGMWQLARHTHVSAEVGNVTLDLTEAEFDERVVDLHVYTGCGRITILVPRGVAVQVVRHRGTLISRLQPPVPGLPLVRLDATTNIGRIHLRHPKPDELAAP
jgi:hypothetical protein